jgi:non-homologous end joining protein Ku
MHQYSLKKKLTMGKNLYIHLEPDEIEKMYNTHKTKTTKTSAYNILKQVVLYNIDDQNNIGLFYTERKTTQADIRYNWLYYASKSNIWENRIKKYNGNITEKTVEFMDEADESQFREKYDYELDEQSKEVLQKIIGEINRTKTPQQFYDEYKHNSLVFLPNNPRLFVL